MSEKYVIEIKSEYEDSFKGLMILGAKDSNLFVDVLAVEDLEELNSDYINEHYGSLQDDAYKRGFEDGNKSGYEKGLNAVGTYRKGHAIGYDDGYEDGKKSIDKGCEGCRYSLRFAKDEPCKSCSNCYKSKYEPMPKEDDRIEVGDEIDWEGEKCTILRVFTPKGCYEQCDGFDDAGNGYTNILTKDVKKTGKHYDIASILEAMRK